MKHVLATQMVRLQSINSRVYCCVENWVVIWHLENVSTVDMKTSGRNFGTMTLMMMMMMMMAVGSEVALSKEDPVA